MSKSLVAGPRATSLSGGIGPCRRRARSATAARSTASRAGAAGTSPIRDVPNHTSPAAIRPRAGYTGLGSESRMMTSSSAAPASAVTAGGQATAAPARSRVTQTARTASAASATTRWVRISA